MSAEVYGGLKSPIPPARWGLHLCTSFSGTHSLGHKVTFGYKSYLTGQVSVCQNKGYKGIIPLAEGFGEAEPPQNNLLIFRYGFGKTAC